MYKSKDLYNLIFCSSSLVIGLLVSYYLTDSVNVIYDHVPHSNISFEIKVFVDILSKNLFVGSLIAVTGFVTGGGFSLLVLFWNGMIVGGITKSYPLDNFIDCFSFFVYHGIFEIIGLLCFGLIGMKGFDFFVNLFRKNILHICFSEKMCLFSIITLFIAAVIETFLISSIP